MSTAVYSVINTLWPLRVYCYLLHPLRREGHEDGPSPLLLLPRIFAACVAQTIVKVCRPDKVASHWASLSASLSGTRPQPCRTSATSVPCQAQPQVAVARLRKTAQAVKKLLGVVPRSARDVVAHLNRTSKIWWGRWSAPVGPRWGGPLVPPRVRRVVLCNVVLA